MNHSPQFPYLGCDLDELRVRMQGVPLHCRNREQCADKCRWTLFGAGSGVSRLTFVFLTKTASNDEVSTSPGEMKMVDTFSDMYRSNWSSALSFLSLANLFYFSLFVNRTTIY